MSKLEVITRALSSNPLVGVVHKDEQMFCPDDNAEGPRNLVSLVNLLVVPKAMYHTASQFQSFMKGLIPSGYSEDLDISPFKEEGDVLNLGNLYFTDVVGGEETTITGGKVAKITRKIWLNDEEVHYLGGVVLRNFLGWIRNPCVLTGSCTTARFSEGTYCSSFSYERGIFVRPLPDQACLERHFLDGNKDRISLATLEKTTVPLAELVAYEPVMNY